mgnify:CR=1 FL=1
MEQLDEAGIKVGGAEDVISEDAKLELLTHLRKTHGRKDAEESSPRRITLNRKSNSELKLASGQGRARTINVEDRSGSGEFNGCAQFSDAIGPMRQVSMLRKVVACPGRTHRRV